MQIPSVKATIFQFNNIIDSAKNRFRIIFYTIVDVMIQGINTRYTTLTQW